LNELFVLTVILHFRPTPCFATTNVTEKLAFDKRKRKEKRENERERVRQRGRESENDRKKERKIFNSDRIHLSANSKPESKCLISRLGLVLATGKQVLSVLTSKKHGSTIKPTSSSRLPPLLSSSIWSPLIQVVVLECSIPC